MHNKTCIFRNRSILTYGLAQRPALANSDLVTLFNTESRGDVGSQVLVSLLVTGILGDEVEVLAADDDGTVHLGRDDGAGQDTATDGDETGEGALLVCLRDSVSLADHSSWYSWQSFFFCLVFCPWLANILKLHNHSHNDSVPCKRA